MQTETKTKTYQGWGLSFIAHDSLDGLLFCLVYPRLSLHRGQSQLRHAGSRDTVSIREPDSDSEFRELIWIENAAGILLMI